MQGHARRLSSVTLLVGAIVCLTSTLASAAETTITHAKALAGLGGCDTPGYPVTICRPGRYVLLTDLRVPVGADGVAITVSLVTLDLNGFSIYSAGECGAGAGFGIRSVPFATAITVLNGDVSCQGGIGISLLGGKHRVEQVSALRNSTGIRVGEYSHVRNSIATDNRAYGILAEEGCTISGNTASLNRVDGIAETGSAVVLGNTARGNGRFGLNLGTTTGFGDNVLTGNTTAQVVGGVSMGSNVCNGQNCQ
jgi:parallel beta-helix repeat protein